MGLSIGLARLTQRARTELRAKTRSQGHVAAKPTLRRLVPSHERQATCARALKKLHARRKKNELLNWNCGRLLTYMKQQPRHVIIIGAHSLKKQVCKRHERHVSHNEKCYKKRRTPQRSRTVSSRAEPAFLTQRARPRHVMCGRAAGAPAAGKEGPRGRRARTGACRARAGTRRSH